MDRQVKEKLHLMSIELAKAQADEQSKYNIPSKENIECPVEKHLYYFWVFGNNIDEQFKLVNFELNRLYMRSRDYRSGYKVLKK